MDESRKPMPVAALRLAVGEAASALAGKPVGDSLTLERPPKAELGDYSTNAAMLLAPAIGKSPREVAEPLRESLADALGESATRIEVAGPGFVNVFLSDEWHRAATASILAAGERFGAGEGGERILLEFVSANPTGPATVAGGRGAAYGDALARVLELAGHSIEREYYVNDAGTQINLFAASIAARMRGEDPPEDGYVGSYIGELAEELTASGHSPDELDGLERDAVETMRKRVEATLERFRVTFDSWFSEASLRDSGALERAIEELRAGGHVYESDGAVWFRTSSLGDDKDRVLIRSDGEPTYFATDIAYHRDKLGRGFEQLITPLGADHHGYVARMRATMAAFGATPDTYEAPIMQLVNVVQGGERVRMAKRRGEFVTLDELIDDIGVDAARFFMVQRSHDTALDIDLELARKASQDNPVYYVQYAHARIAGIIAKAAGQGSVLADPRAAALGALTVSCEPSERILVRRLLELPAEVSAAAERRSPHRLTTYASAIAADFHAFYRDCRVVGEAAEVETARLALCHAAMDTIATVLELIGVSAPETM